MNISILILFLSQLQRFLTFTIIDLNQQYQVYNDDIDLSVQDFGVNKLLTYGIWSKYNPLSLISKIGPVGQMESKCFLIHNAASTLIQNLNLIYYDCLDDRENQKLNIYTQLKILKIIEFVDEENNQQKIEFLIDNNKYEDIWHFCQFIIQPYQKKFEVIILNQEETLLHQFLELKFPFKDKDLVLIFGSSLIVNNSQIFSIQKGQKFATFPGFLKINKPVIQRRNIDLDFETMAFEVLQGFIQCQCIQESAPQLKDWDLSSFNKFTYISENTNCDSFQFQGWLRINDIRELQSDVTYQIFKISSNFHSVILTDQNLSPFQYLYKLSSQMHRIIFTTYSYKFPIVNIDFTDNPFLIVDQFDAFDKVQLWHKLIVNLLKNELQVSIRFYDETEPFTISRLINVVQFHFTQFKVHYGNLLDSNNNFANIQARNFVFFNCQQPINEFHCHQSCFECDGPTNQNCLSCKQESNRIYIMDLKMCTCQYGLIDADEKCQSYSDLGFQLIKDVSISKDITCSHGYFVSGDECIQCPSNINPQRMTCLECLMNPQQWSNLPFCNQDVFINKIGETAQYDYDNYQAYYLVDFDLYKCIKDICDEYSIYNLLESNEFSLGSIQNEITTPYFIYKCTESCNNCVLEDIGFICKECPEAFRLQDGKCQDVSCFPPYYMNIAGRCKKCPLKNCKYCFEYLRDDLTKSTLYHDFQTFNTDEIINVGCALCDDNYTFEFSQGICIQRQSVQFLRIFNLNQQMCISFLQRKLQIQNCLRSYINLENQEICTLTSIHDFSIAPEITNCQEFIENCLQCIQTPEVNLKCIVCTIGYISSLKNGIVLEEKILSELKYYLFIFKI